MTTETATHKLTKVDVKALRECDSVCFDHYHPDYPDTGGIRAIKRGKAPWYQDHTHQVPCHSSVHIHDESLDYDTRNGKGVVCFAMIYSSCNEEWRTIVGLLKPGDEVELRWEGGGGNGYVGRATVTERDASCNDAGLGMKLFQDRLYLHIKRGGRRRYSFYVVDSVCPNNTARMVRY